MIQGQPVDNISGTEKVNALKRIEKAHQEAMLVRPWKDQVMLDEPEEEIARPVLPVPPRSAWDHYVLNGGCR